MLMLCCAPWMAESIAGKISSPFWRSVTALPSITLAPSKVPISRRNCALSTALTCPSRRCNCFSCGQTLSRTTPTTTATSAPIASHRTRRRQFATFAIDTTLPAWTRQHAGTNAAIT